jgi:hypothetical protein
VSESEKGETGKRARTGDREEGSPTQLSTALLSSFSHASTASCWRLQLLHHHHLFDFSPSPCYIVTSSYIIHSKRQR